MADHTAIERPNEESIRAFAERILEQAFPAVRSCRVCGCSDRQACVTDDGPCWWVEDDLCSECA